MAAASIPTTVHLRTTTVSSTGSTFARLSSITCVRRGQRAIAIDQLQEILRTVDTGVTALLLHVKADETRYRRARRLIRHRSCVSKPSGRVNADLRHAARID